MARLCVILFRSIDYFYAINNHCFSEAGVQLLHYVFIVGRYNKVKTKLLEPFDFSYDINE